MPPAQAGVCLDIFKEGCGDVALLLDFKPSSLPAVHSATIIAGNDHVHLLSPEP